MNLPPDLQARLDRGVSDVRDAWDRFADDGPLGWAPPVVAFPEFWVPPDKKPVHAFAGLALLDNGPGQFGVNVSATVLLCEDAAILESVLVHECAHCFYFIERLAEQVLAGQGGSKLAAPTYRPTQAHEEQTQVDPGRWLGGRVGRLWSSMDRLAVLKSLEGAFAKLKTIPLPLKDQPWPKSQAVTLPQVCLDHFRGLEA